MVWVWQHRQRGQNKHHAEICSMQLFLRLLLFAVFLFEGDLIFFPPLTISYSDSRRLTQRHKRNVLRGQDSVSYNDTHQWNSKGAAPLQWDHIPTLLKWWVQCRDRGNKPGGCSLSYAEAFCIMNSIIIFCSCTVLCWVLILTDESSGGQKAVESEEAAAGFSVLWPQL